MQRILLLLGMAALTACHDNSVSSDERDNVAVAAPSENVKPLIPEEDSVQEPQHDVSWEKIEVFHFAQALMNNKVPLFTNRQRFLKAIGEPDSVVTPDFDHLCATQFEEEFRYFYKNGSCFEWHKDSLACEEFVLTPGSFITCDKRTFTSETTWEEIRKIYPQAVKQAENEGSAQMITLRDSDDLRSDSAVRLFFEGGKLVRIVNFIPC
ncbi:hypothetical protein [Chitinophaga nivalis]|uniref:Lipoprotein n=1 Tax=Chitinophaga nivalis TaxID=2991709 RepID=A0ABT3IEH6_9BACT|nr:hypothetical protein [Chitinophaga nivalis]MCW3468008.1 hypothetical protein [Chitinophaga nivalis]MCW3482301.1 hypothetical protein [Chitinophaga nivalis]